MRIASGCLVVGLDPSKRAVEQIHSANRIEVISNICDDRVNHRFSTVPSIHGLSHYPLSFTFFGDCHPTRIFKMMVAMKADGTKNDCCNQSTTDCKDGFCDKAALFSALNSNLPNPVIHIRADLHAQCFAEALKEVIRLRQRFSLREDMVDGWLHGALTAFLAQHSFEYFLKFFGTAIAIDAGGKVALTIDAVFLPVVQKTFECVPTGIIPLRPSRRRFANSFGLLCKSQEIRDATD